MRRALTILGVSLVLAGCSDTSGPNARPLAPSGRRSTIVTPCDPGLFITLKAQLTALYVNAPNDGTNVLAQLDNINKSCLADRPSTRAQTSALVQTVLRNLGDGRLVDPDVGGLTLRGHVAEVVNGLYAFSSVSLSGSGVATPSSTVTVTTVDQNAGITIPAGAVSQEVVIIITPLPDNTPLPNNPYPEYPPAVDITTSIGPITFATPVTVGLCEDASVPSSVQPNLRIGHGLANNTTEILPLTAPPSFLACYGPLASNTVESPRIEWRHPVSSAHRMLAWAGHHAARVFLPTTAYAIHGGLGGLTSSLSPFKPVDVGSVPIAFESDRDGGAYIYTMNPDGSNQLRVGALGVEKIAPVWSPDRSKLAFSARDNVVDSLDVFVMNADGTNVQQLTFGGSSDLPGSWSPDGTKILFGREYVPGVNDVWVMNADGTGQTKLTNSLAFEAQPRWSPDGMKIVYSSNRSGTFTLWTMNANGSSQQQLAIPPLGSLDADPSWSPTGAKIAFTRYNGTNYDIWVMNADGTNQVQRTAASGSNRTPSWNPTGTKIAFNRRATATTRSTS